MSDPAENTAAPQEASTAPQAAAHPHSPVQRATPNNPLHAADDAEHRRVFFNAAMREVLPPLAGILERRITPLLAALEALPSDVERFEHSISLPVIGNILDQPQSHQIGRA